MNHYKIDMEDVEYPLTKLNKEYDDNISFKRTELLSIEIKVLDTDPKMAAEIANDIANLIDSAKNKMQKTIAVQAFEIVKTEYEDLQNYIIKIKDSLKMLGKIGIHDYKSQSEVLNREYAVALSKNDQRAIKSLGDKLDTLGKYGSTQMALVFNLENTYKEVYPILKRIPLLHL